MQAPVRVLVVDDSELFLDALTLSLEDDPGVRVIGRATDGRAALEQTLALSPDVITMDVMMPRVDGLSAVESIMKLRPTPILVLTGDPRTGLDALVFDALSRGALDLRRKPVLVGGDAQERRALVEHVKLLASVPTIHHPGRRAAFAPPSPPRAPDRAGVSVVGIAASTGGPSAVVELVRRLPASFPAALVLVQHMDQGFIPHFVSWLSRAVDLPVRVVEAGAELAPGTLFVAPEDKHVTASDRRLSLDDRSPPCDGHRPSATVLFRSLARSFGARAAGVVLTGMGRDGAEGLAALRAAGAPTFAQDPAGCAVDGMPRAAQRLGAVERVLPPAEIARALLQLVDARPQRRGGG